MQHPCRKMVRFSLAAAFALASVVAQAQQPTADEILNQVVERNAQRQALLSSYTSVRTYQIDYSGVGGPRYAQLVVRAEFRAGEKSFAVISESGSKMICSRVLRKLIEGEQEASGRSSKLQSMLSPENYDATLVGRERVDGVDAWVLDVAPKVPSKFTYSGRVWVSTDDDAVVRIHAQPAKNPSIWLSKIVLDSQYRHVGAFWLPASNSTVSHIRLGGEARLTIDYGDYKIEAKPELAQNMHTDVTGESQR